MTLTLALSSATEIGRACAVLLEIIVSMTGSDDALLRERSSERLERLRAGLTRWFSRRTGNAVDAQDLVQDSLVRIVERERSGELEHLEGYAYRVAANILTDWHRRRTARHADDHVNIDQVPPPANEIDPHRLAAGSAALKAATAALEKLPERTRTILILRRIEGMRHKEIAVRMGMSVSAVEKHVVLALAAISKDTEGWQ